ncbi:hypothetical protein C2845_PM14G08130 [Panicum miliaceum]|uniref:Uncharacterized protein n=1 Tax=Panicum miliaceum TaxID=4540 RepID=A0A3L6PM33_PANMI|nr:hypothetical protein C2845_PM14G08130 [Panicum miliaceum]
MAFLERALRKHITEEGLDGVRLFSTIHTHRVVPLAMRTTKMLEYTGPADPNRVSPEEMPDDEVWSWVELVLKGVAGAAKQAALVEASLARKKKKAEKAKRRQEKDMQTTR